MFWENLQSGVDQKHVLSRGPPPTPHPFVAACLGFRGLGLPLWGLRKCLVQVCPTEELCNFVAKMLVESQDVLLQAYVAEWRPKTATITVFLIQDRTSLGETKPERLDRTPGQHFWKKHPRKPNPFSHTPYEIVYDFRSMWKPYSSSLEGSLPRPEPSTLKALPACFVTLNLKPQRKCAFQPSIFMLHQGCSQRP